MQLYFVRHGESEVNVQRIISNRVGVHGLTARGCQQAEALARRLAGAGIERIFTSPVLRALQTADILAARQGVPVEVTDALREYDCGDLEGKTDAESWQRHAQVWQDWFYHGNLARKAEGGESFLDIKARFVPFIEHLRRAHMDGGGAVALVGHGGTYRCMLPLVLTNIDFEYAVAHPIDNTAYILAKTRPDGLLCRSWCDTIMPAPA